VVLTFHAFGTTSPQCWHAPSASIVSQQSPQQQVVSVAVLRISFPVAGLRWIFPVAGLRWSLPAV
jgi:hypothetical protein